ncbi:MAG: hypothetical protein FD175_2069 [Beijerinckiaceae bacterium]|nr:MAG: hypothetical protein FD175_2069 [Beijerinckiaceae bacterium]
MHANMCICNINLLHLRQTHAGLWLEGMTQNEPWRDNTTGTLLSPAQRETPPEAVGTPVSQTAAEPA